MRRRTGHLGKYGVPLSPLSLYGDLPSTPAYTPPAWNQCQGDGFEPRCIEIGTHRLTDEDIAYRRQRPELNWVDPATLRYCPRHCRGWHIRADDGAS